MNAVLLGLHLMVAIAMVFLVLMQRSEGGALGMGGGSSSLMSGRGAADALAKGTGALAALFFVTSISLTLLAGGAKQPTSVVDRPASSISLDISGVADTVSRWVSGLPGMAPKPAAAPVAPPTVAAPAAEAPTEPEAVSTVDPNAEVVPAPGAAVTRAAPLADSPTPPPVAVAAPKPAALTPAAAVKSAVAPRPVVTSVKPASVGKPAAVTGQGVKPGESSEPQTPAAQPKGRAGPDE